MALSRDQLLSRHKRRYAEIKLQDGATVWLQSLSDEERSRYEVSYQFDKKGNAIDLDCAKRRLLVRCLVDGDGGTRLFADDEEDKLRPIDGKDIGLLYDAARKHCGFEEGEIEALVKNSGQAPG